MIREFERVREAIYPFMNRTGAFIAKPLKLP